MRPALAHVAGDGYAVRPGRQTENAFYLQAVGVYDEELTFAIGGGILVPVSRDHDVLSGGVILLVAYGPRPKSARIQPLPRLDCREVG